MADSDELMAYNIIRRHALKYADKIRVTSLTHRAYANVDVQALLEKEKQSPGLMVPYLASVVRSAFIDYLRYEKVRQAKDLSDGPSPALTPMEAALQRDELDKLGAAIRQLSETHGREVEMLTRYFWAEQSAAEIGGHYDLTPTRVRQLLRWALTRLAELIRLPQ